MSMFRICVSAPDEVALEQRFSAASASSAALIPSSSMPDDSIHPKHSLTQPVLTIDGADLLHMAGAAYAWLKQHTHIVNALNVFPVPDGDTGTNMVLTMHAAWKSAVEVKSESIDAVVQALAHGAVRGARGNSGVILSQILRGWAEILRGHAVMDVALFATAMRQGKDTAYKGVMRPVEGTMLTVMREAAEASGHAAAITTDLRFVLETSLAKAQEALANTPNLLPVLKQAGVVDAGGQGLCYVLEGMAKHLRGEHVVFSDVPIAGQATPSALTPPMAATVVPNAPSPNLDALTQNEWGYDIQYLVYNEVIDENAIRQRLLDMGGESVVVGRAGPVLKVHVHSADPGPFLSYGASLGHLDDIVLENMTLQTLRRKGEWNDGSPLPEASAPDYGSECPAIVAVVSGEGLRKVFESLGVCALVSGGQTMNPSTEELLLAAERLPQDDVIILPNNKNIILAAKQAATLAAKRLHVIETWSIPQGIAAMLGFNPTVGVEQNVRAMSRSAKNVRTGEVTTAVREVQFDGVRVRPGDIIGLMDDELVCKGETPNSVVQQLLDLMNSDGEAEIFTFYFGEPISVDEAQALRQQLETSLPNQVIEFLPGGQPHYHYLISVE